jgi:hypothetical protein
MLIKNPHPLSSVMICQLGHIHVMDMLTYEGLREDKQKLCKGRINAVRFNNIQKNIKSMTTLNGESLITDEKGDYYGYNECVTIKTQRGEI